MEYETKNHDYKGRATGGLVTGIIGTSLAGLLATGAMSGGNGFLGGLFSGNNNVAEREQSIIASLGSEIAQLKAARYTDYVGMDLYKNIVAFSNAEDAKIRDIQSQLSSFIIDIDKRVALNAQATELNRQYDNLARDAGFKLLEQKLDCCCDKANMRIDWNAEKACMSDMSILSFVQGTYVPGVNKLPITSICPEPATTTA
jgi:hypothetical protein